MRESRLMLVQYVTAVAAVVLVAFHLLMQGVLVPYGTAISFDTLLADYRNLFYMIFLELLLVVVLVHGFNGLRIILHEWKQSKAWTQWVDVGTVLAIVASVGYGTRTIILAVLGGAGA
jgi:succinate dehydrogenase / fumarate reductase membrane anchor subunit